MIYNENEEYKIKFFTDLRTGKSLISDYLADLTDREHVKVTKYIEFLRQRKGVLDEPYSKHVRGKIRELRVDFGKNRHRIFYFTFIGRNIILLHAFLKNTTQTPEAEINRAEANYNQIINNPNPYAD